MGKGKKKRGETKESEEKTSKRQKKIIGEGKKKKRHCLVEKIKHKGSCKVQEGLKGGEDSFSKQSSLCRQESHGEDLLWTKINA